MNDSRISRRISPVSVMWMIDSCGHHSGSSAVGLPTAANRMYLRNE